MQKTTEQNSRYNDLEMMSTFELISNINKEDKTVPIAVEKCLPQIEKLVNIITDKFMAGGRLFYIGAGTSGRLGVLDASECPPTYGVPHGMVIGIIAGGDTAIRKAVEFAEDNQDLGWQDLQAHNINQNDVVVGIAASGTTPYVVGALKKCRENNVMTACVVCNEGSPVAAEADIAIECVVGPEFVTGSTRMKAGTAQKLILNMLTTASMIKIGRVVGNKMVDMQLSNNKLIDRGVKMIMEATGTNYENALKLLQKYGSVRLAIENS
jgi:N-acetylmuramic acid 6-phosphate etherase